MSSRTPAGLLLCGALLASASAMQAQQAVPIRDLSPVDAKTTAHFGTILGLRQLTGGKVLINDGARRQLVMLDANLANPTVVIDSVSEGGNSYGPRAAPLIPYLADSTLFVDGASLSLLVLDPSGKVAHVMAAPKPGDLRFLAGGASGVDAQGNLVYRGATTITRNMMGGPPQPGGAPMMVQPPDSAPIVRANFETRSVDTIGRVKIQSGSRMNMSQDASGKMVMKATVNPLPTVDEWAVLSDGTVAFVRGHDYHVDFLRPDGKTTSTPKLPFDWRRLTDDDKQKLIDSARTAMDKAAADAKAAGANPMSAMMGAVGGAATGGAPGGAGGMEVRVVMAGPGGGGGGGGMSIGAGGPGGPGGMPPNMQNMQITAPTIEFVPIKEIADYYPAIRSGAAKADLDGNLWILPTTSAQSKAGELVYDVVNNRGELIQRVRLPVGRSIAGFGHNGVVYLMYRDVATGWFVERAKISTVANATN